MTVFGPIMSMNPGVAVSSVNLLIGPNVRELSPLTVNPNESPNHEADVSFFILWVASAESTNVHSTASFGETTTVIESAPVVADTALPAHVTLARLHPFGIVLSVIV